MATALRDNSLALNTSRIIFSFSDEYHPAPLWRCYDSGAVCI